MKNFAIMGVAGYIAPRHLKAIKDTGNRLMAAFDPVDSVGIIDSFFPDCHFFTEFERFDRHVDKCRREDRYHIDYISICSPNYLHDSHIRFALRIGANAICEKPLVLNPWNIDALVDIARETDRDVNVILQLRHHESVLKLKEYINSQPDNKVFDVDLGYVTPRGKWYDVSWKGDTSKSGGIATNIGVHFFDMLIWLFGDVEESQLHIANCNKSAGYLKLQRANVRWMLSLDREDVPGYKAGDPPRPYRSITVDGKEIDFTHGFTELHTTSYKAIFEGKGYKMEDTRKAIEVVANLRNTLATGVNEYSHPLAKPGS